MFPSAKHNLVIITIASAFFFACNKKKVLEGREYLLWVENKENGLKKEKKLDGLSFRAFFKPADYVAVREALNTNPANINNEAIQQRSNSLQGHYLFNFDIVSEDGKQSILQYNLADQQEHAARINYFVSHAQQDFKIVQGQDTLPCVLYHFEQTFGLSPLNTISLGFEKKPDLQGDVQLIYNCRLFNTGELKFLFTEKTLTNIPELRL